MAFDLKTAIPVSENVERKPAFDMESAEPYQEPIGEMLVTNVKEAAISTVKMAGDVLSAIRWPFWRFIEHPVSTLVIEAQEHPAATTPFPELMKTRAEALGRAAQAFVPFRKIPREEYGTYGKMWNNYYKAETGYDAPDWYIAMASLSTAVAFEPTVMAKAGELSELALTRVANPQEAEIIRKAFSPIKSRLEKGGIKSKDLYADGNIIKINENQELFINKYISAVLRGDEIRIPRWAKVKSLKEFDVVGAIEAIPTEPTALALKPVETLPLTGKEVVLTPPPLRDITLRDFNQEKKPLAEEELAKIVNPELIKKANELQKVLGKPIARTSNIVPGFSSGARTPEYTQDLIKRGYAAMPGGVHEQGRGFDIPVKQLGLTHEEVVAAAQQIGLDVEDIKLTPGHVHVELPTPGSKTKLMKKPDYPIAGGMMHEVPKYVQEKLDQGVTISKINTAAFRMVKPVQIKDIHGVMQSLPVGHEFTEVHLSNGKIWLHDGKNLVVDRAALDNLPTNSYIELGEKKLTPEEEKIKVIRKGAIKKPLTPTKRVEIAQEAIDYVIERAKTDLSEGLIDKQEYRDILANPRNYAQQYYDMREEEEMIPTKFSQWQAVKGGKDYTEVLLQAEPKGEIKVVERKVGGENRYNMEVSGDIPLQQINKTTGVRGKFEGQGYHMPYNEVLNRIPKSTFNILRHLEQTKNIQWADAYVIPYNVGNRSTQKLLVEGRTPDGSVIQYYRNPGNLTGMGTNKIFIAGKASTIWDALGQQTPPDYPREIPKNVATKKVTVGPKPFTGGHYPEENVFVHYRKSDFDTPQGNVRVLQEVQSDWHLAERRGRKVGEIPFKNWVEMGLKQALRDAARDKVDYFAWSTGQQTADLYNLSKVVNNIEWELLKPENIKTVNLDTTSGKIILSIGEDGIIKTATNSNFNDKKLEDVIGKDFAKRILEEDAGVLTKPELTIGGEWAYNLYDKQVPNIVKNLTKAEVTNVDVNKVKDNISIDTNPRTGMTDVYNVGTGEILFTGGREEAFNFFHELPVKVSERMLTQPAIKMTPEVRMRILGDAPMAGGLPVNPKGETSIGKGGILNTRSDTDFTLRSEITSQMPFTLLGNKAEVISRMSQDLKEQLRKGIKNVYDLFGGAKGYRIGLFGHIPADAYRFNEYSNERNSYYKNIQDPAKMQIMVKTSADLKDGLITEIAKAFDIDPTKYPPDYLKSSLNKWLGESVSKERYQYVRDVVQKYGDKILAEAQSDNFASPESSAKYHFLENTAVFGLKQGPGGYTWSQGLLRTNKGKSSLKEAIMRLENAPELMSNEFARDKDMPITKEDAWQVMDKIIADVAAGKINPDETVVLVDPQYLNPTVEAGTYSVGVKDAVWAGHKQNLEQHLLPLIDTGTKIIYTNNLDPNLEAWLKEKNIPYNIETEIGAVSGRGGRNEIISIINYKLPEKYTSGNIIGPGRQESGEQGIFSASESFKKWLEEHAGELEKTGTVTSAHKQLIASMRELAASKNLSITTISRLRKALGIENLSKATDEQLNRMIRVINKLKQGDQYLSESQQAALASILEGIAKPQIIPKRILIEKFGEKSDVMEGLVVGKIPNELFPTVDIKEGHPLVKKVVESAEIKLNNAELEVERRDDQLNKMLIKAEKSRKLRIGEKVKRFLATQNKEIFEALGGERDMGTLTREERAVVSYLRNFFKMAKEELVLEKFRKNYVPHLGKPFMEKIMTEGIIKALFERFQQEPDVPINIMLELDDIIGSEKFFKFALPRKGYGKPTTNIRRIVHEYSQLYEIKKSLDTILPEGQAITKLLLQKKTALWMKRYLQNLKGRALDFNFRTGKGGWLARTADTIIDLGYMKLLALNWQSALKNLVAGEANSFIYESFKQYMTGKQRLLSNPKKVFQLAKDYGILEGTYADYTHTGIGKIKKLEQWAMIGQQAGEWEIRGSLFVSQLTPAEWESGEISDERIRELKDTISVTQGIFSKVESPLFLQTWYGRMVFQMNRWRITNAMLIRRLAKGAKEEWARGEKMGKNSRSLSKAFILYGIGMYLTYELGKAGYDKAAKISKSMAEDINSIVELVTMKPLVEAITDNPTISLFKEFAFTIQELANYIAPAITESPEQPRYQRGIEDTYIAPKRNLEDIVNTIIE